jgi:hypothetical protein
MYDEKIIFIVVILLLSSFFCFCTIFLQIDSYRLLFNQLLYIAALTETHRYLLPVMYCLLLITFGVYAKTTWRNCLCHYVRLLAEAIIKALMQEKVFLMLHANLPNPASQAPKVYIVVYETMAQKEWSAQILKLHINSHRIHIF